MKKKDKELQLIVGILELVSSRKEISTEELFDLPFPDSVIFAMSSILVIEDVLETDMVNGLPTLSLGKPVYEHDGLVFINSASCFDSTKHLIALGVSAALEHDVDSLEVHRNILELSGEDRINYLESTFEGVLIFYNKKLNK